MTHIEEAKKRVIEWAEDYKFEAMTDNTYRRKFPFGSIYIEFKGEDVQVNANVEDCNGGIVMISERQPLWLSLHCVSDSFLKSWIRLMVHKLIDNVMFNEPVY